MKKMQQKDILIIGGLLLAFIAIIALSVVQSQQIAKHRTESVLNATETNYAITKLTFCVDHAISPCSDEQISDWNAQNPSETFALKSFEMLTEEAIEAGKQ